VVGLLAELVLPTTLAAALLLALAGYTSYWDLGTRSGLGIFGGLLVVLGAVFIFILANDPMRLVQRQRALDTAPTSTTSQGRPVAPP